METHIQNLCSAFNPFKCTHTLVNTHTHTPWTHTPGAVGSHIAEAPEEQLGVRCLAQGSHLSCGIEGGREHWSFPTIPAGPSSYKPNSLTIRPQLPLYCLSYCCKGYLHGTPGYFYKYDNISMLHVQNVTWHQLFYHSDNSNTYYIL